jgi:hypothetical protein
VRTTRREALGLFAGLAAVFGLRRALPEPTPDPDEDDDFEPVASQPPPGPLCRELDRHSLWYAEKFAEEFDRNVVELLKLNETRTSLFRG